MRRLLAAAATVALALTVVASPVAAITGNYVKDFEHTFVGLVVFYDETGDFSHRCTGSLLSPSILLTAGHCTDGVTEARVYFQQDAGANYDPVRDIDPVTGYPWTGGYTGTAYTFGEPFASFPNTQEVGIVILDKPLSKRVVNEYASIAAPGSLDAIADANQKKSVLFTVSGYGLSDTNPQDVSFRERLMATIRFQNLHNALTDGYNLQTLENGAQGRGGSCFGDSGGPVFYDTTDVIVAVVSFGTNGSCAGQGWSYRVDQQAVLDWILDFAEAEGERINVVALP